MLQYMFKVIILTNLMKGFVVRDFNNSHEKREEG